MSVHTMSSRKFNQDISAAKKASLDGPVIVTDRGRPAHVLLSIEDYQRLTGEGASIVQLLSTPEVAGIAFDPPQAGHFSQPADLS